MGVTYKAFDVDLHCRVTLKVISERYLGDESARLRFLREARAAARLRHTNVASVLHLGRTGQNYFYAMEFVEGETLENLIKRSGRLELKLTLEIATQVAAGLAAIHKQKLVHRDIKPSNIMVSVEEGSTVTAKIIDLGLAKPAPNAPAEAAISTPGAFAGTPEFASPEQFAGVGVDIRCLFRCRLDRILGSRRLARFNPISKTLAKHAYWTEFHRSRNLVTATRAGALGLRAHGLTRPLAAI